MHPDTVNPANEGSPSTVPALRLAVAAALFMAATAGAQTLPNQSSLRFDYGSRLGQQEVPAGATLEPRVDAALQYASNIDLAADGGDDAFGIELSPGIYAAYSSDRFLGALDYSLIGRLWDDGDLDDVTQSLEANGRWEALQEMLFIDGDASYGDTVIDVSQGQNYGNLGVFNSGNITEQATVSLGPTFRRRFKDFEFNASYNYGRVWLLDQAKGSPDPVFGTQYGQGDSEDQRADVNIGLVPEATKAYGKVFYTWEHSDFENALPYEFERAGFDGGWELSRTLTVVGDVGKESALDVSTSEGGLDSDFWSAGLRWKPSNRSSAEVRYGDRFFGNTFKATISHTARFVEMTASYDESPDVDSRQRSLGRFDPGQLPPGLGSNLQYSAFNNTPYLGKTGSLSVSANGLRTRLALTANYLERDYLDEFLGDEKGSGISFMGTRSLASNVSVDVQMSYYDFSRDASLFPPGPFADIPASKDYDTELTVRGNREFGPRLIGSLEAGFFNRGGTSDYDGWWLGLRGRWFPDFGK